MSDEQNILDGEKKENQQETTVTEDTKEKEFEHRNKNNFYNNKNRDNYNKNNYANQNKHEVSNAQNSQNSDMKVSADFKPNVSLSDVIMANISGVPGNSGSKLFVKVEKILEFLFTHTHSAKIVVEKNYVKSILHYIATVSKVNNILRIDDSTRKIVYEKFKYDNR